MPTYAYACPQCGHTFEIRQSFSDDALTTCPECTGQLRKLFNNVGVVFKGSGFYRNDSRSSSGSGEPKETSSKESSSKESSAGSKESTATPAGSAGANSSTAGSSAAGSSSSAGSGSSSGSGSSGSRAASGGSSSAA